MRRLILFDIDGTLTSTALSDARCFAAAFEAVFGFACPSTDWHDYEHVTDTGIVEEILQKHRGHAATPEEFWRFAETYVAHMEADFEANPADYMEVPGARRLLDQLRSGANPVPISLSTGCMHRTAMFKLSRAGIDGSALPGGFADDAVSRADIARKAIARSGVAADDIVYVGDGVWDAITAADLGMRFIGITRQSSAERLREHGASALLRDYSEPSQFFEALEQARVPHRAIL